MPHVTEDAFQSLLTALAERVLDPQAGLFSPASITWKINRESALFLGAGRAALLQLAHPWVAVALQQHSDLMRNPLGRFHGTFRVVFSMIFGTRAQAFAAARHLYRLHTHIEGSLPHSIARFPRGSEYQALEVEALRWVFATLVESAVLAYQLVQPPLTLEERESYYRESKVMAALFGIPESGLPADWDAFEAYNRDMTDSDTLGVNDLSRGMAHGLLRGAGSWVVPPRWYRALTAMLLPDRLRQAFQLTYGPDDQRALERASFWLPVLYCNLPVSLRFVGPYHEACARLARRSPGVLTRASNRFWIGQPHLIEPS